MRIVSVNVIVRESCGDVIPFSYGAEWDKRAGCVWDV